MGNRKKIAANNLKNHKKQVFFAILKNAPVSPKKAVLVADLIRGLEVTKALAVLDNLNKSMSIFYYNLLKSSVANYRAKTNLNGENLRVSKVHVCQGMTLKRIQPAPQGRAHRILKRYSHIRIEVSEMQAVANVEPQSQIV